MKELLLDIKNKLDELYKLDDDYQIRNFKQEINKKIKIIEYKEKHGIDLKMRDFQNEDLIFIERFKGNIYIKKNIKVLNSDKQPSKDEELIYFKFPTGAYIFGEDYDTKVFNDFFEELKKYNYKYIDDINNALYFDLENGCKLFKKYAEICKKYQELYDLRSKERKKEELKKQLQELEEKDGN